MEMYISNNFSKDLATLTKKKNTHFQKMLTSANT